jgi:hypothetical protein
MIVQDKINYVVRPGQELSNGKTQHDRYGKLFLKDGMMLSYRADRDADIPNAGLVVCDVSSRWVHQGNGNSKDSSRFLAWQLDDITVVERQLSALA